jgi:imidazolonepropionase-like amidohydrolase
MKGVDLGYNTQEHMVLDKLIPEKYIEKFNQKGMAIMPTMMIYGDEFKINELLTLISKKGDQYFTPEVIRQMLERLENSKANTNTIPSWDAEYMKLQFPVVTKNLQRLYKMGAVIGAGSDIGGTMSGFFSRFTDELGHYIQSGISNFDTLRMATSINAQIIDMQENIGTVKKGLFADLIAVDGNPLDDIKALKKVKMVMKGGVFIKYDEIISK